MKNKLVWRLGKLPTVEELLNLVKDKIITQEEAKEVLFSEQTEQDRDKESYKSEIKFLRELVESLAGSRYKIVETIKYIEKPYKEYPWYRPYSDYIYAVGNTVNDSGNAITLTSFKL